LIIHLVITWPYSRLDNENIQANNGIFFLKGGSYQNITNSIAHFFNFAPVTYSYKQKIMEAQANNKSRSLDWLLFLASTAVVILLLIFADEWFWVALPFSLTYLVRALNAM
jgi:hypothetical protein